MPDSEAGPSRKRTIADVEREEAVMDAAASLRSERHRLQSEQLAGVPFRDALLDLLDANAAGASRDPSSNVELIEKLGALKSQMQEAIASIHAKEERDADGEDEDDGSSSGLSVVQEQEEWEEYDPVKWETETGTHGEEGVAGKGERKEGEEGGSAGGGPAKGEDEDKKVAEGQNNAVDKGKGTA